MKRVGSMCVWKVLLNIRSRKYQQIEVEVDAFSKKMCVFEQPVESQLCVKGGRAIDNSGSQKEP